MKVTKHGKNDLKEVKTNNDVKKKFILEIAAALSRLFINLICKTGIFQLITLVLWLQILNRTHLSSFQRDDK